MEAIESYFYSLRDLCCRKYSNYFVFDLSFVILQIFFKAGVLADLEDKRDDILSIIMTKMQSKARGKLMRIEFQKMLERQ